MLKPTFGQCFWMTFKECVTNLSCATFFLFAILFYSFYYAWPYMAQRPENIDTILIDEDLTPLSRQLLQELKASPNLHIIATVHNKQAAIEIMRKGEVSTLIGIPQNFEKDALNGIPTALTLATNGAFIVKARSSISGASGPLQQLATKVIAAHLIKLGIPASELAKNALKPPLLIVQPMYNTVEGYLNFAVPIVFVIIFQTVVICGTGMLINDWFWRKTYPAPLTMATRHWEYLFSIFLPIFFILIFWTLFIEGFSFAWHGINSFTNIPATLLTCVFFSFAATSLGLCISMAFKRYRFIVQSVVTSSIPFVFVSGNLYPQQNIPTFIRYISYLVPSTPGSECMLRSSQAGATPNEIYPYLAHLLILGIIYFVLAYVIVRRYRTDKGAVINEKSLFIPSFKYQIQSNTSPKRS